MLRSCILNSEETIGWLKSESEKHGAVGWKVLRRLFAGSKNAVQWSTNRSGELYRSFSLSTVVFVTKTTTIIRTNSNSSLPRDFRSWSKYNPKRFVRDAWQFSLFCTACQLITFRILFFYFSSFFALLSNESREIAQLVHSYLAVKGCDQIDSSLTC